MLLKALDLLRLLGWSIIDFIFRLIDTLFEILRSLNSYNIIDSIAGNSMFSNFHKGIIAIAVTLLGLFAIWRFVMKMLDPDEGLPAGKIVSEILICGLFVVMTTFLFAQVSTFSIKLSGYTASIFTNNNTTISNSMLTMYVDFTDGYKESDEFLNENISANIGNNNFTKSEMYNDKYVTSARWILPDKKDYKYDINWIMAILVGGFFLYSLFFSGMMLARRQIEFLFLFVISPVIFATAIGNKQRRGAVIEQLVSLMLQGAVIMLIICLTALVMQAVNNTTFFPNSSFQDGLIKSLMFIGCGSFLLTGSGVVNRFIGGNVSANSGREQMMAMMGFGRIAGRTGAAAGLIGGAAALFGAGATGSAIGKAGGKSAISSVGGAISNFGNSIKGETESGLKNKIGNTISSFGKGIGNISSSHVGTSLRRASGTAGRLAVNTAIPQTRFLNFHRSRNKGSDE